MIWFRILLSIFFLFFAILDVFGIIAVGWPSIALLVIASLPVTLPLMSKYLISFKAGKEGIEGEFRQGTLKLDAVPPIYTLPAKAPDQITNYELFSVWARKILKALWTYQVQHFGEDTKERWGFTVNKNSADFFAYHIGIGELLYRQFVFSDSNGLHFLTDAGIKYCQKNRSAIEAESHYYKNFGSLE
jgi:hypothetical protein